MGVVLCPAFGQEEICTHSGMLALAEMFAKAGIIALRFDYRGTGDSNDEPPSILSMTEDAVAAGEWLRAHTGINHLVFVGVRLGAAIAAKAAAEMSGIAGLALLAPVISGSAYLREVRAAASVASLSGLDPVPPVDSNKLFNTTGFHWPMDLLREVSTLDLAHMSAPDYPTLLLPQRAERRSAELCKLWKQVTVRPFEAYLDWMKDPTTHETPFADFAAVVTWTAGLAPVSSDTPAANVTPVDRPSSFDQHLDIGLVREKPVRFGPNNQLFGIFAQPASVPPARIAALLLHEGSSHHIGNGRAYVALARKLAEAGIVSLRMDISGMGDSLAGNNSRHPYYDPERIADVRAGLDWLESQGFERAVSFGLCSGAYSAYHVALQDARITGFMIINLQKFIFRYGDDISLLIRDSRRSLKGYMRAARNPGEWRRALSGSVDLAAIVRLLLTRFATKSHNLVLGMFPPAPGSERMRVREQMLQLDKRSVHGMFIFSDEDPGLSDMWEHFGRKAKRLANYSTFRMVVLPQADHQFNGSLARRRYFDLVLKGMTEIISEDAQKCESASA